MTPVEVARVWGPEVGKITLDLKEPIGKKLSKRREAPGCKDPNPAHLRWISTTGLVHLNCDP